MSDELLPCPFCGGAALLETIHGYSDVETQYYVHCLSCAAEGGWGKSEGAARACWNRRVAQKEGEA